MATGNTISNPANRLRHLFLQADIVMKLVYINLALFLIVALCNVFARLFNAFPPSWPLWLELPADIGTFLTRPWTLVTYMFMHAGGWHLLFNMLWLYGFGRIFQLCFSSRHLRGLYLLGGICGGLFYMIAYHVFPYFTDRISGSYLVGASASVLAIVVATAVRTPDFSLRFFLIGSIRLKYVALFMVVLDLLFLASDNAGGHLAHVGGALAGWWFAYSLSKGHDPTRWINALIDLCMGKVAMRKKRKSPKMSIHYGSRQDEYDYNARKKAESEAVDRILEKIKKSGYTSLSEEEKRQLFDASNRK